MTKNRFLIICQKERSSRCTWYCMRVLQLIWLVFITKLCVGIFHISAKFEVGNLFFAVRSMFRPTDMLKSIQNVMLIKNVGILLGRRSCFLNVANVLAKSIHPSSFDDVYKNDAKLSRAVYSHT